MSALVHNGSVRDGDTLSFVSDPKKTAKVTKQPNGDFKLLVGETTLTVHAFAQQCLGQEPPDHAAKWLRTPSGKTLFELWHADSEDMAA